MGQSRGNRPPQDPTVQVVNKTGHESGRVFISKSPTVGDEDHLAFTAPMLGDPAAAPAHRATEQGRSGDGSLGSNIRGDPAPRRPEIAGSSAWLHRARPARPQPAGGAISKGADVSDNYR